jgi:ribosome recycling factor
MSQKYSILPGIDILQRFKDKTKGLRTGRVTASVLDPIQVEVYGTKMDIRSLASVTLPEPGQLLITPFDKSTISNISKAIQDSPLGVTPMDDGAGIRLSFPPLTEETRKQTLKELNKLKEEARKDVRIHRQEVLNDRKKEKEEGEISEDDFNKFENDLQKEVDAINQEIEDIAEHKESEVMEM